MTFNVKPIKNNQDIIISILFYADNNLFQEARVGARVQVTASSATPSPTAYFPTQNQMLAPIRGKRNINLQITQVTDGYRFVLFYDLGNEQFDVTWCTLSIAREKLADLLESVRDALLKVVRMEGQLSNGKLGPIFYDGEPPEAPQQQQRLPNLYRVDDATYNRALDFLARAGRDLFVTLFYPATGSSAQKQQANRFGEALRQLSRSGAYKIQILSETFIIPWNLLYDGEYPSEEINPDDFWGFKHIIEEVPYRTQESESISEITLENNRLDVGLNINRIALPPVLSEPQLALVNRFKNATPVVTRFTEAEVLKALRGKSALGHLEYFYCHAGTGGNLQRTFDQSYLGLTSADTGLTLEDIKLSTVGTRFERNPLFVLNACESAQMDGRFYDGFVPLLLNMGACAVIGTDSKLPSLIGAHFGSIFLQSFFSTSSIGEALLSLRKQFLKEYHNPLALIYRIFGNADVHLTEKIIQTAN